MRYLGNNYTSSYQNVKYTAGSLINYGIDPVLVNDYIQVMTVGYPNLFVAEPTRDNVLKYWRAGNNPSINTNLAQVMSTVNKEDRNNFVVTLSFWARRFIPHVIYAPQHYLQVLVKRPPNRWRLTFPHTGLNNCEHDDLIGTRHRVALQIWGCKNPSIQTHLQPANIIPK